MKKLTILSAFTVTSLISFSAIASDDYSGFRVGAGLAAADSQHRDDGEFYDNGYEAGKTSHDNGIAIEVGYDVNRIVGLKAKLTTGSLLHEELQISSGGYTDYEEESTDRVTINTSADFGYAFQLGKNFTIKPYVELGLAINQLEMSEIEYYNGEEERYDSSATMLSVNYGLGVRATYKAIYLDAVATQNIADNSNYYTAMMDEKEATITMGYKF